jgi:hypothetical protein
VRMGLRQVGSPREASAHSENAAVRASQSVHTMAWRPARGGSCHALPQAMKPLLRLSVGVVILLASSCADTSPPAAAPPQPVPVVLPEKTTIVLPHPGEARIVREMSSARCDHEQACGNIGPRKKYVTRDDCIEDTLPVVLGDVTSYVCPRGIDSDGATECMAAIRQLACSNEFEPMASVDLCRTQAICAQ